jgi:hypothetical protein
LSFPVHQFFKEANMNKHVLVTTKHRGVFFGELVDRSEDSILLKNARNCVYWTSDCHGFLGLAAKGPTKDCRVGPAAPELALTDVTSVATCSDEAVAAWEAEPWS